MTMTYSSTKKQSSVAAIGAVFVALGSGVPVAAATFTAAPLFDTVNSYSTTITANGDPADIYFPVLSGSSNSTNAFPIALMLQGALVDKSDYSSFARQVASYGFVVVVPNHQRTLVGPTGAVTGLYPEQQQLNDVLAQMGAENSNSSSPIAGRVDTNKLGLLGHSFGGAVGLNAVQGTCLPPLCFGNFTRPAQLKAAAFYGTSGSDPRFGNAIPPINNGNIATALISGTRDGVSQFAAAQETYNQIQNPPKTFVAVGGANHYSITNEDNLLREPNRATLDQAVATETIARWSAMFLRAHVLNDAGAFDYVYNTGDALDENVSVISQTQSVPEPSSVLGVLVFGAFGAGSMLKRRRKKAS